MIDVNVLDKGITAHASLEKPLARRGHLGKIRHAGRDRQGRQPM
jgi:hypothetical protein